MPRQENEAAPPACAPLGEEDETMNIIDGYRLLRRLGAGGAGAVYLAAATTRPNTMVAVKLYQGARADESYAKELELLRAIRYHPNVVTLRSNVDDPKAIIMPFYGTRDLHTQIIEMPTMFPESKASHVIQDLLSALHHIHGLGIIHRDVKPENIALDSRSKAVLLDFDVACLVTDRVAMRAKPGSPGYAAPEVVLGMTYNERVDCFSVGCVLYFLFCKTHPFFTKTGSTQSILRKTVKCNIKFGIRFDDVSVQCKLFLMMLLERHPNRRFSTEAALNHYFLTENLEKDNTEEKQASSTQMLPQMQAQIQAQPQMQAAPTAPEPAPAPSQPNKIASKASRDSNEIKDRMPSPMDEEQQGHQYVAIEQGPDAAFRPAKPVTWQMPHCQFWHKAAPPFYEINSNGGDASASPVQDSTISTSRASRSSDSPTHSAGKIVPPPPSSPASPSAPASEVMFDGETAPGKFSIRGVNDNTCVPVSATSYHYMMPSYPNPNEQDANSGMGNRAEPLLEEGSGHSSLNGQSYHLDHESRRRPQSYMQRFLRGLRARPGE